MRQKTDAKRQQILDVAARLFLKFGLESVSMSQVAADVGGSKATLYNYFQNKEELFVEVVMKIIGHMTERAATALERNLPLMEKLKSLGIEYLKFILEDDSIALYRNVLIYPHRGRLSRDAYDRVMRSAWKHVTDVIDEAMKQGRLKKEDPWLATLQLKKLFELDLIERRLLSLDKDINMSEIERNVEKGLNVFLSYYRPAPCEGTQGKARA